MLQGRTGWMQDSQAFAGIRKPVQSYQMVEGQLVDSHPERCLAIVQCLPGTMRQAPLVLHLGWPLGVRTSQGLCCRQDAVLQLDWQRFALGGAGCIAAAHVLPELAYKLGCAPKYGA